MWRAAAVLAAVAVASLLPIAVRPVPAAAQPTPTPYDPRTAFAETDTNHDGAVDHEEFIARMTEVFYRADADKDGHLTAAESATTLTTPNVAAADANHDGTLTLHEFMRARLKDYDNVDTNRDGLLELDEVTSAYQNRSRE